MYREEPIRWPLVRKIILKCAKALHIVRVQGLAGFSSRLGSFLLSPLRAMWGRRPRSSGFDAKFYRNAFPEFRSRLVPARFHFAVNCGSPGGRKVSPAR